MSLLNHRDFLFPLGAMLGGIVGELIGLRATLWIAGIVIVAAPLPIHQALRHVRDVDALRGE